MNNLVELIILQHPLETSEAKNTALLLHFCLNNSQLYVGEHFDDAFFDRNNLGHNPSIYNILLYPETLEEKSLSIASPPGIDMERLNIAKPASSIRLWVIDATWRKSRKMLYLNPALQGMPRLILHNCPASIYKIRKAHSENQLSTLEASCYALQQLEENRVDYAPVLTAFSAFITQHYTFIPSP